MVAYAKKETAVINLSLDNAALNSGGAEGGIYKVKGKNDVVAKIYKNSRIAAARRAKIDAMVKMYSTLPEVIKKYVAWPFALLYDNNNQFIGFLMRKLPANEISIGDLYFSPKAKTLNEKIKILVNLCELIQVLHDENIVVGDLGCENIRVDPKTSEVYLVDADSFHINSQYRCLVCCPDHVAPELLKKCKNSTYEKVTGSTFTAETDNYALAIHIFRAFFNGWHPFLVRRLPSCSQSLPRPSKSELVEKGLCPWFHKIPGFDTPKYAPSLNSVPSHVVDMFRRTFVDGMRDPIKRITAKEWQVELEQLLSSNRTSQVSITSTNICSQPSSTQSLSSNDSYPATCWIFFAISVCIFGVIWYVGFEHLFYALGEVFWLAMGISIISYLGCVMSYFIYYDSPKAVKNSVLRGIISSALSVVSAFLITAILLIIIGGIAFLYHEIS